MQDKKRLIKAVAAGTICSMLCCIILTAVLAAVMLSTGMPGSDMLTWATAAIMGAGALAGGFIAAKIYKGAGIPVGGLTGLSLFCVTALASFSRGAANLGSMTIVKLAASVLLAVAGGILGISEKRSSKYGRF